MSTLRILGIAICFNICTAAAQQGFVYEDVADDTTEYVSAMVELSTGGYLATIRKITAEETHCKLVKLTENGTVTQSVKLAGNSRLLINAVTETEAGILLFGTSGNDITGNFVSILLDYDLAVIEQHDILLGSFEQSGVYVTSLDSFLLISGTVLEGTHFRSFLVKTALNGEVLDFNPLFVDDLISNGVFRKSDQRFLFFGYKGKRYEATAELDLASGVDQTPYGLWMEGGMAWANDSTMLIVGKRLNNLFEPPYDQTQNIGIGVLDQNWNKKNLYQIGLPADTIDFPAFNTPISLSNSGQIFVGGNANNLIGYWLYGNRPSWYVLAKLHPDNFSPAWVKYYGGDAYYSMFGILATADGGCLMYGAQYTKQGQADADAYILKVGADGTTKVAEPGGQEIKSKIEVFPNPVSNHLSISSDQQPFQFYLFDVSGRVVKCIASGTGELDVDVSDLPAAAYFYKVIAKEVLTGLLLKQ